MSLSPNVNKAVKKSAEAQKAIDDLNKAMNDNDAAYAKVFKERVDASMAELNLPDAQLSGISHNIRVSFSSEFSIDGIANIVIKALETAGKVSDVKSENPAMTPEAIEGYVSIVEAVAAAAKSKSSTEANLSYSVTQIGPGTFAFLYAVSQTIEDQAIFGTEAVTATAVYYRLANSVEAVKRSADFKLALFYYYLMEAYEVMLLKIPVDLGNRDIDLHTAQEFNSFAKMQLREARVNLKKIGLDPEHPPVLMTAGPSAPPPTRVSLSAQLSDAKVEARAALETLKATGGDYAAFAEQQLEALENAGT